MCFHSLLVIPLSDQGQEEAAICVFWINDGIDKCLVDIDTTLMEKLRKWWNFCSCYQALLCEPDHSDCVVLAWLHCASNRTEFTHDKH